VLFLGAGQERLPLGNMLEPAEVAVGDDRKSCLGDPAEEGVAVEELEPIDERGEAGAFAPETPCGSKRDRVGVMAAVGMGGDQPGAVDARDPKRALDSVVERDKAAQTDGNGVRGAIRILVVEGQLGARDDDQAVPLLSPRGLPLDLVKIGGPRTLVEQDGGAGALLAEPRIVVREDVIGHAEDIEAAASVQVDQLGNRQAAITPGGMRMQLAEERPHLGSGLHAPRSRTSW
jgi:hypothetical protein